MATFEHFYKSLSPNSQVRGKEFEKLVKWFLQTDPRWKNLVKKVWLWDEHPQREEWGPDCGIDLVFEDLIGNIWAVQAKCFDSHNSIRKEHMDSFIAESSDSRFQKKLLVATTNNIGPNVDRLLIRHSVVRILLDDLIEADVEYPENPKSFSNIKSISIPTPRDHQKDAIEEVNKRFKRSDRGQLIMACGTGKTLTAFWIKEKLKATNVLVLLPSLSLLSQTLKEWNKASKENFKWICICSDKTVAKKDETKDDWISNTSEIGLPVTSNSGDIKKFLKEQGKKITFSTYQSSPLIVSAQKDSTISDFDIVFADEAHRCAGKVSEAFGSVLDDKKIRSKKRLFLTATPRVLSNQIKGQAKVNDIEIASMDDASVFGEIFFKLSFSDAIKNKPPLLTDYQVVITGVDEPMINESILKRELYHWEKEKYKNDPKKISDSETLATMIALTKAIKNHDLKKLITFHGTVKKARHLSERLKGVANFISPEEKPKQELNCDYVYGKMKTKIRNSKLRLLKKDDDNEIKILSNARCLSEGVDVPALDGVAFIDPKKSQVDIIQAVGRAIRLSKDKKIGTIILPVFLGDVENVEDKILESRFADIWQIIIALKDQDDSLSELIDSLRVELGKKGELTKKDKKGLVKIIFDLPKRVDRLFVDSLTTILVENTTENWLKMYGKLIKFTEENGHARPPIDKSELGNWVSKQRSYYLRKKLIKRRLDLLNKLLEKGWIWDAYEAYWFEKYELLKIYFQKNKHSNVPQDDPVLGKWVHKQRTLKNKNKLPTQKINLLKKLNFVWDAKEARWFMKYELLKDYVKRNGHANPPAREKIIGSWVSNLRAVYERKQKNMLRKGEETTLTKERITLLEKLPGWTWKALEDSWIKKFNRLHKILSSVDQYKFSDLPNDLANWVSRQKDCYEDLSLERKNLLKKLEKLGLRLENKSEFSQKQWVSKIKNFYKINGHFVIPSNIDEGVTAGMIRQGYKKGTLNQSTIDELKNLEKEGWMWDPSLEISLEKIKLLKEWCKENNSLDPPRNLIIKGNNKTYVNNPKKKESERRNFNLGILVTQLKSRYKYTKYEIDPVYKEYFPREKDKQIREMTPEEINEVESIKIDSGNWYWEPFDGYLRVFKECLRRNIEIKQKTKVNFDLERFQNIGRWIQTVYTSNKRKTLEKYNYDKLKNIQSDYFRDLIYHKN